MQTLRAGVRFLALILHLSTGVLTVLLLFPFLDRMERDKRLVRWAGQLLGILHVRLTLRGRPPTVRGGGALIVANHTSWLDIYVIHSLLPARFVAKAEVRSWPVIGWLAETAAGSLFLERSRKSDAKRVTEHMAEHLRGGECLAMFPEGTTTDGRELLPFYPTLFQPAVAASAQVWPALIRYLCPDGRHCMAAAYFGEMSLLASLRRILHEPEILAEIDFLPPLAAVGERRRELAAKAEQAIRDALAAGGPGSPPETTAHLQA